MRSGTISILLAVSLLTACSSPDAGVQQTGQSGETACAAMFISTDNETAQPGESISVTVENVYGECLDQGESRSAAAPASYELLFVQDDEETTIATFSEADGPTVEVTASIPDDAKAGAATLSVEFADEAEITIVPS